MNKLASFTLLATLLFSTIACERSKNAPAQPTPGTSAPKAETPAPAPTAEAIELFCYKDESEQTYSAEALQSQILFEDEVETKDVETVDCNGRVINREHRPERHLVKTLLIEAADGVQSYAQVEVSNQRTCSLVRAAKVSDSALNDEFVTSDGKVLRSGPRVTQVGISGDVKLFLSDDAKMTGTLLMAEGMNAVQVRYLGQNGELLGTRDILVSLNVKHPEAFGVRRIRICESR